MVLDTGEIAPAGISPKRRQAGGKPPARHRLRRPGGASPRRAPAALAEPGTAKRNGERHGQGDGFAAPLPRALHA